MPEKYSLDEIDLPEDSEVLALSRECDDLSYIRFFDGEYIVREHDRNTDIFLVVKGGYLVEKESLMNPTPDETLPLAVEMSKPTLPCIVGAMAYLGNGQRTASVRSSGCTHTICLKPRHLDTILAKYPTMTRHICRLFVKRLKEANELLHQCHEGNFMQMKQVVLSRGDVLFSKGDRVTQLYQVVDGELRDDINGLPLDEANLVQGFVAPRAFFQDACYETTVSADSSCFLIAIDADSKLAAIRNFPELILHLLKPPALVIGH